MIDFIFKLILRLIAADGVKPVQPVESTPTAATPTLPDFKTERCETEFADLEKSNLGLYEVALDAVAFCMKHFDIKLVVTDVLRTQAEQDYIYRNSKTYIKPDGKKRVSPHQLGHGVDFRSIDPATGKQILTNTQLAQLGEYINSRWNPKNAYKYTIEHHTVTDGVPHLHTQFINRT